MAIDKQTVEGFGQEWYKFDQSGRSKEELHRTFLEYFKIFPWNIISKEAIGFDLGCGTGRWANFAADQVGTLYCIDASPLALQVAMKNLQGKNNCRFLLASSSELPYLKESMDFGYSIGVLHHTPDPVSGIRDCVAKLKPGAPFLVYLYYALDNRPTWFRLIWQTSNLIRHGISRLPFPVRFFASQVIAATVYYPLAKLALLLEHLGLNVEMLPLSAYRHKGYYVMRTDALDRFGTRLEHRFTATQIKAMLEKAGLERITFSASAPYWCAIGYKPKGGV